jgi:transketolase
VAEREDFTVAPVPSGESWDLAGLEAISTSAVAGKVLAAMGDEDPDIVVLTADLKFSNQTVDFERAHPERFINVGISEQHMVTMAAGMASVGLKPYVATFAPFVGLLAGEHIRTDLAYPGLAVRVIAHHAGIAIGFYGTSHHATEDLGLMRSIAGLTVVCPCDATATEAALRQTADLPGPVYFRVGRGRDVPVYDALPECPWKFGEAAVLREGGDLTIVANGVTVSGALEAARALVDEGIEATVIDAHTVRPFDGDTIAEYAGRSKRLLVAEEHNVVGGVATACAEALVEHGLADVRMARIGMPADEYSLIGPPTHLYRHYGMDGPGIEKKARELLGI